MRVKDLVSMLKELDQEKEIKGIKPDAYELEVIASGDIKIAYYPDSGEILHDGSKYYSVHNYGKPDFYLIQT